MYVINLGMTNATSYSKQPTIKTECDDEMAHESGCAGSGPEGSPHHTPSPPHVPRLPPGDTTFHHQIMQSEGPRMNHIAERAKQTLEHSFLMQLKKQQQLQQEILLQHFQQQRQQLAEQHKQQLLHHQQMWEAKQKAMEEAAVREAREAREARERERERDRVELLRKKDKHEPCANASTQVKQKLQEFLKKKQAAANANGTVPGSPYRNWGIVKSSSGESITSTGATATAHPYRLTAPLPLVLNAPSPNDFPLRKTASEPNMLKLRLKARVIERRTSPLVRRPLKTRHKHRNCEGGSPRGSPPGGGATAPIREEEESGRAAELLFSSPSMPNISLGRPHLAHVPPATVQVSLPPVSEAEAYVGTVAPGPLPPRLPKRPLGRTHSAPLPLGDPALQPPQAHFLIRDQIRKTVLTRAHDAAAALREEEGEVIDLTARRPPAHAAPLARALSSPLVGPRAPATGLAYDPVMLKHGCGCGAHAPTHPEHSGRLQSIWARLCETGLAHACERTRPRKATVEELESVHSSWHVGVFGGRRAEGGRVGTLVRLGCGGLGVDSDTAWAEHHTPAAARMAAGAVLDLAARVAAGDLANGFAVVRPPGHHAERDQAMGFCFFNNVAVAARVLHQRMRLQRILIVDWDVHHGNGTQQIFYSDPWVLYMSLHRHDEGNFFPGTGGAGECGAGAGLGYTVNVPWSAGNGPPMADAEYLAAFRTIIMPIAKEYEPELVLVSCGFDAAGGHPAPLGGYNVSAACFAAMTRDLMTLAGGKVVLSLEGGYDLPAMCDCAQECVRALTEARAARTQAAPHPRELARAPARAAQDVLRHVIAVQQQHWPVLKKQAERVGLSELEARPPPPSPQSERDAADTAAALATLSMHHARSHTSLLQSAEADSSRSVSEEPMEQDDK